MPTVRFHDSLDSIDATAWDTLVADANPFVSHAFLSGLERHGCIRDAWGWRPHHLTLHGDDGRMLAAAPLYLKGNSHGEYVFDWAWADAWERAGGRYYPKLLCAAPYSPVTGPRLLADTPERRRALIDAIVAETRRLGLSSAHVDFPDASGLDDFDDAWLRRFDWQYHWHNRGYRDFDDFLAALKHKKRKNIRAERAQVHKAGIDCRMRRGDSLDEAEWRIVHALYLHTFETKGNSPTLSLPFFRHMADVLGDGLQVALAHKGHDIIAMALFLRGGGTLYGRYWGAREFIPSLHFELCYYQGIEYAVAHGLTCFEPGAQGRHKLARGFVPVRTHSRHYLVHEGFRDAVAAALEEEAVAMREIGEQLYVHSPYHEDARHRSD
ncbi:MAG TPA: GNAT family N-acetyltransferase [Oleiagrimonas sp.]|nr:GNAT family N-acetyltransferase [Oleiagrimonas sp.]